MRKPYSALPQLPTRLFLTTLGLLLGMSAASAGTISGRVFEDVNYGGGNGATRTNASGVGIAYARVEIYIRNNAGNYVFSGAANTDVNGAYSFNYGTGSNQRVVVRVVSSTVYSTRPLTSGHVVTETVGVPTFRRIGGNTNGTTTDDLNYVGGESPALSDAGNGDWGTTLASLTTSSATAQVQTSFPDADGGSENFTNIDFGFNFSTIVNANDSGRGSLRQFIINSNALANTGLNQRETSGVANNFDYDPATGVETAIFMITNGGAQPGLRESLSSLLTGTAPNARAVITLASALPAITDANTSIDGTTQTSNVRQNANNSTTGSASNNSTDTNSGQLGSADATVGTDKVALTQVNNPEVELVFPSNVSGMTFSANNSTLRGVAARGGATTVLVNNGATNFLLENSVLGTTALDINVPASNRTSNFQLYLLNPTGTVRNNIIAYAGSSGINYSAGAGTTGYVIRQNEFLQNGYVTAGGDNISVGDQGTAGPLTIEENLIRSANSSGIQFEIGQVSNNIVRNNTIQSNGKGGASTRLEGSGIHYLQRNSGASGSPYRLSSNTDLITKNIITANQSSGVVINYGQRNVQLTQNSIFGNGDGTTGGVGLLAVDLTPSNYHVGGNAAYGQGDGVTPNDGLLDPNAANGGLDYPVITRKFVTTSGNVTQLRVIGYVGRDFGQTAFGGVTVELYKGDNTTDNNQNGPIIVGDNQSIPHGEPLLYLGSFTTGADGSFNETINIPSGISLTITDPINSVAFKAGYGTSEAGINLIPNTLPVELVNFEIKTSGHKARLIWRTAQEKNNDYFDVERSRDGRTFTAVGKVRGQGTKTSVTDYAFEDAPANQRLVYYRLKQVDTDGTTTYSQVLTAAFDASAAAVVIFPNPAGESAKLDLTSLPAADYALTMLNSLGKVVYQARVSGGQLHALPTAALKGGTYVVRLTGAQTALTLPFIRK